MVLSGERLERLCQADKADAEGPVLEYLSDVVLRAQLVGIEPDPLAHQEGIVIDLLAALDLEAVQQLADHQIDALIQQFIEALDVPLRLNPDARQVDGGKLRLPRPQVVSCVRSCTLPITRVRQPMYEISVS